MVEDTGLTRYAGPMARDVESLADHVTQIGRQEATADLTDGLMRALAELQYADSLRRAAERLSQTSAELAREEGASWREIGAVVGGISPQGAEHRFSAAAKERRSKASKVEWASRERRRTPRFEPSEDRSYEAERG
jgi:hypothetical protein